MFHFTGYLTSSPTSTNSDSRTPSISNFDPTTNHDNFNSSNIEAPEGGGRRPFFNRGSSSVESSPIVKHASNVGTPVGGVRRHELSFSPVEVSPIGGGGSTFDEEGKNDNVSLYKLFFIRANQVKPDLKKLLLGFLTFMKHWVFPGKRKCTQLC